MTHELGDGIDTFDGHDENGRVCIAEFPSGAEPPPARAGPLLLILSSAPSGADAPGCSGRADGRQHLRAQQRVERGAPPSPRDGS